MAGEEFVLGMDAALYYAAYNATPAELEDMDEIENVRDLTLNLESSESDVTTRANKGWRATAQALRECSVEFEMVWKPEDPAFEAIRDAFLSNSLIHLAILDQDREIVGAQGPKADFSITKFNRTEPLEQAELVAITAKLTKFDAWVEVVAES